MTGMRMVIGVDGCRAGWVGVRWTGGSAGDATVLVAPLREAQAKIERNVAALVGRRSSRIRGPKTC